LTHQNNFEINDVFLPTYKKFIGEGTKKQDRRLPP